MDDPSSNSMVYATASAKLAKYGPGFGSVNTPTIQAREPGLASGDAEGKVLTTSSYVNRGSVIVLYLWFGWVYWQMPIAVWRGDRLAFVIYTMTMRPLSFRVALAFVSASVQSITRRLPVRSSDLLIIATW